MAYAVYLYFSGLSLRRAARALRLIVSRSHVSMWRWVQRLGPILGSIGADPREVHRIFVDETMVNLGGTPAWIWVAFEPDLHRCMPIHREARPQVQWGPDPHGGCAGARMRAGAERAVYDRPLRNLMERMVQYLKDRTEAFDDLFPVGGRGPRSWRAFESPRNWLSAFMLMHDFVFEGGGLGRPSLGWEEEGMPRWLDWLRPIFSLG